MRGIQGAVANRVTQSPGDVGRSGMGRGQVCVGPHQDCPEPRAGSCYCRCQEEQGWALSVEASMQEVHKTEGRQAARPPLPLADAGLAGRRSGVCVCVCVCVPLPRPLESGKPGEPGGCSMDRTFLESAHSA